MTMNKLVWGLLASTLCACGGGMDTSVINGEEGTEATDTAPEAATVPAESIVDTIQWRDETIQFINTAENEGTPDILMVRSGTESGGEILYQFQQQAKYDVTAAELWRAVTGREDIPEALVLNHQDVAAEAGRPADYQNFDPNLVQKAAFAIRDMFPLTKPNTCWSSVLLIGNFPIQASFPPYICSTDHGNKSSADVADAFHQSAVSASGACPTKLNTKEGVRAGVYNGTSFADSGLQTAQLCFDGGSSGWVCQNIVSLPFQSYYMGEYAKSSSTHRFAVGAFSTTNRAIGYFGSAKLSAGVQQFQTTTCTGEIK